MAVSVVSYIEKGKGKRMRDVEIRKIHEALKNFSRVEACGE
jgi:hypothetical protein